MNLNRALSKQVLDALDSFIQEYIQSPGSPQTWKKFYLFTAEAFIVDQKNRPSVSFLSDILKEKNIETHANFAVVYAHCLYSMAVSQKIKIYGDGFNP